MKLIITYECDFGDRETFESLEDIIINECLNIIPSNKEMSSRLPVTLENIKRRISIHKKHFVETTINES